MRWGLIITASAAALLAGVLAQDEVPVLSFGVPDTLGKVEYKDEHVTVTRYEKWEDAYTDGVLSIIPPGKKLDMGVEQPKPKEEANATATAANATANATASAANSTAKAAAAKEEEPPKKKRTTVEVKTFDTWQAAYLEGYGWPAPGEKLPKKPNATANGTDTAKKGSRRMMLSAGAGAGAAAVPRDLI